MSSSVRFAIVVGVVCVLAGCAAASTGPVVQTPANARIAGPIQVQQYIYGCALDSGTCVWYRKGQTAIAGQITTLSDPQGIGVDPNTGNLFIANAGIGNVVEFAPNNATPLATFNDAGQIPVDVAVGNDGNFYVANFSTTSRGPGTVTVYDGRSGNILRVLTDPRVNQGESVTIDERNDLVFCFRNTSRVAECDDFPGARGHGVERASGWGLPGGTTFDNAEHLVEIDQHLAHVLTYNGTTRCGKANLPDSPIPSYAALDRSNATLYVSSLQTGVISAYTFSDCANGTLALQTQYNTDLSAGILLSVAVTPGVTP